MGFCRKGIIRTNQVPGNHEMVIWMKMVSWTFMELPRLVPVAAARVCQCSQHSHGNRKFVHGQVTHSEAL